MAADRLRADREFRLFWSGQAVSMVGSTLTGLAFLVLAYQLTGSAFQTSLLSALYLAPYLVFGLVAGAMADRMDRRQLMIVSDVANAAVVATIPVAAWLGLLTMPQLYLVAVASSVAFVWSDAAQFGALVTLVGRERIAGANSALWSARTLISVLAPAAGGLIIAAAGAPVIFLLDALTFLLGVVTLLLIRRPMSLPKAREAEPGKARSEAGAPAPAPGVRSIRADIAEGLQFILAQPLVRILTILGMGNSLAAGAVSGLLVVYGVEALGIADSDAALGYLFAAGGVGAFAATLALPPLTHRLGAGRVSLLGYTAGAAVIPAIALSRSLPLSLVLLGLWGGIFTLVVVNGMSVRQVITPDDMQSRVNSSARIIAGGGEPLGAVVAGALAELAGVRAALLVMSLTVALSALAGWLSPLRHYREGGEHGEHGERR